MRLYVDRSVEELYDWLVSLGVRFNLLGRPTGASVARFHRNPKRGFGIVEPVYRACLATGKVDFKWNHRVTLCPGNNSVHRHQVSTTVFFQTNLQSGRFPQLPSGGFRPDMLGIRPAV